MKFFIILIAKILTKVVKRLEPSERLGIALFSGLANDLKFQLPTLSPVSPQTSNVCWASTLCLRSIAP